MTEEQKLFDPPLTPEERSLWDQSFIAANVSDSWTMEQCHTIADDVVLERRKRFADISETNIKNIAEECDRLRAEIGNLRSEVRLQAMCIRDDGVRIDALTKQRDNMRFEIDKLRDELAAAVSTANGRLDDLRAARAGLALMEPALVDVENEFPESDQKWQSSLYQGLQNYADSLRAKKKAKS
jgi:hypothetical protein